MTAITEVEKDALIADILSRLRNVAEGTPAPQEFMTVWLPMIVAGAVDGYAAWLEEAMLFAPVELRDALRATFCWEGFCAADRMFGIAHSTSIWMEVNA